MKYIQVPGEDSILFDRYEEYITPNLDRFPSHLRELVSQPRYFDLNSPETLHDAHLIKLEVKENPASIDGMVPSSVNINILLNGAYRKIKLHYGKVRRYAFRGCNDMGYFDSFHSDLITHEFRIENNGFFIHELSFATDSAFEVEFAELRFEQEEY